MFLEHLTTEDWSNVCWKFSFDIATIYCIFKYIQIEKKFFYSVIKKLQFLLYLWKLLLAPIFWMVV